MIEPRMATMLGVPDDRRGDHARAAAAGTARRRRRDLQRHHRRRRVLDQRLRVRAGERRERRRRSTRRLRALRRGADATSPASSRSASSGAARARPSSSPSRRRRGVATPTRGWRRATIANSLLVKTAVHGGDPNWGRLVAAAGRSGVAFELDRARRCGSATSRSSPTGGRTTSAPPMRPTHLAAAR